MKQIAAPCREFSYLADDVKRTGEAPQSADVRVDDGLCLLLFPSLIAAALPATVPFRASDGSLLARGLPNPLLK
jgi:hypothetical protein